MTISNISVHAFMQAIFAVPAYHGKRVLLCKTGNKQSVRWAALGQIAHHHLQAKGFAFEGLNIDITNSLIHISLTGLVLQWATQEVPRGPVNGTKFSRIGSSCTGLRAKVSIDEAHACMAQMFDVAPGQFAFSGRRAQILCDHTFGWKQTYCGKTSALVSPIIKKMTTPAPEVERWLDASLPLPPGVKVAMRGPEDVAHHLALRHPDVATALHT